MIPCSDVVLQDFCNVVGHENLVVPNPHERAWLRNVFTEPVGSLGQCEDPAAPLATKATECVALPTAFCDGVNVSTGSNNGAGGSSASTASAVLALAVVTLAAACVI